MCQRVQCQHCLKPTYAGCGAHIEQVLGDVPKEQRCGCRAVAKTSPSAGSGSALDWLRGRR